MCFPMLPWSNSFVTWKDNMGYWRSRTWFGPPFLCLLVGWRDLRQREQDVPLHHRQRCAVSECREGKKVSSPTAIRSSLLKVWLRSCSWSCYQYGLGLWALRGEGKGCYQVVKVRHLAFFNAFLDEQDSRLASCFIPNIDVLLSVHHKACYTLRQLKEGKKKVSSPLDVYLCRPTALGNTASGASSPPKPLKETACIVRGGGEAQTHIPAFTEYSPQSITTGAVCFSTISLSLLCSFLTDEPHSHHQVCNIIFRGM